MPRPCLFLRRDPQCLHLPVKMAALQAEHFGGAGYVAVILVEGVSEVNLFPKVSGGTEAGYA